MVGSGVPRFGHAAHGERLSPPVDHSGTRNPDALLGWIAVWAMARLGNAKYSLLGPLLELCRTKRRYNL